MSSTKSSSDDLLGESWVDICVSSNNSQGSSTPYSMTSPSPATIPQLAVDYLRLLNEAQRESNQSSARVSLDGSRRDSPRSSPKSPPNSPNHNQSVALDWQAYYMNHEPKEEVVDFYDWSSRPFQVPPKVWTFRPLKTDGLSIRYAKVGNTSMFSRKGLYTLFLTNILSLILGTGVGLLLSKHGFFTATLKIR